MKKVKVRTVFTQVVRDGYVAPASPIFTIVNSGNTPFKLNNIISLSSGGKFEINGESFVSIFLKMGIPVENATQYHVTFAPGSNDENNSATLIETFITLE